MKELTPNPTFFWYKILQELGLIERTKKGIFLPLKTRLPPKECYHKNKNKMLNKNSTVDLLPPPLGFDSRIASQERGDASEKVQSGPCRERMEDSSCLSPAPLTLGVLFSTFTNQTFLGKTATVDYFFGKFQPCIFGSLGHLSNPF